MKGILQHLSDDEQSSYFLAVLENVVEGIIVIDHKGCILGSNKSIKNIFGYSSDEINGKNVRK